MNPAFSRFLRVLLLAAVVFAAAPGATSLPAAAAPEPPAKSTPEPPLLHRARLRRSGCGPARSPRRSARRWPPESEDAGPNPVDGRSYSIVQFAGPVQEAWKETVRKLGGTVLDYIPDFAFIVYMDDAARAEVRALPEVAWVGAYRPAFKLSPELAGAQGVRDLLVQTFPVEPLEGVAAQARAFGAEIGDATADAAGGLLRLQVDAAQLVRLARIPAVRWIEPFYERVLFNDIARGNAIMGAETAWTDLGLYGQGQIVAVSDTGLDTGSLATLHQDFLGSPTGCSGTGRIVATYALGRTNNWSDSCLTAAASTRGATAPTSAARCWATAAVRAAPARLTTAARSRAWRRRRAW